MSKQIYFILLLTLAINNLTCCKAQKNVTTEMEIYNFNEIKNSNTYYKGIIRNGWKIMIYAMNESGGYYKEYPPIPDFYVVYKTFYKSGKIKSIGKYTGEHLGIGETVHYNEEGNVINVIDEDSKFGKVKLENLLKFIEQEGWIDLKTGEGREDAIIYEDGQSQIIPSRFRITAPSSSDNRSYWTIQIHEMPYNHLTRTIYHIDKDTGEVLHKESKIIRSRK